MPKGRLEHSDHFDVATDLPSDDTFRLLFVRLFVCFLSKVRNQLYPSLSHQNEDCPTISKTQRC